ncbi:PE domain-containing protein [Pseudonocardia phyllosphaerae]|uniref:PE domain-containing protein n=1 Tax=Pseudonocardia phyllosphaerae TaxID=3390502 RepID=UPI00397BDD33
MAITPEQQRSIDEDLLTQVNVDTVLKAAVIYQKHADDIDFAIAKANSELTLTPLGGDPISADAVLMFQPKIGAILDVHRAHAEELRAAVLALEGAARRYGYTEEQIARALRPDTLAP